MTEHQMGFLRRKFLSLIFTDQELVDIAQTAKERKRSVHGLIHDAVMGDLFR